LLPAQRIGQKANITKEMKKANGEYYGNEPEVDNWTALLCSTITNMTDVEKNSHIYDGKKPRARALADWWERHQAWDKEREVQEQIARQQKKVEALSEQFKKLPITEQERLLAMVDIKKLT
jgi:hypothetical protein